MLNKSDLLKQFKEHHSISEAGLDLQYQIGELNHQFYSGDEMAYSVGVSAGKQRKIVVFNRIKPFINSITGFMIKLRRKPDYQARIPEAQLQKEYSTSTNSFSDYIRANANVEQVESRQDKEMLITGIGAVDQSVSYIKNPFGEVAACSLKFDEFGYDPQARAANLLDSRWVYRRKVMNREDAADLFSAEEEDFEAVESPLSTTSTRDRLYAENEVDEDLVQVFYYQWWEYETYYRIENPLYEDIDPLVRQEIAEAFELLRDEIDMENEDDDVLEDLFSFDPASEELVVTTKTRNLLHALFDEYGIEAEEVKHKRQVYYTAIISGKKVFQSFKSKDQNGFTIKFKTGDYDETRGVWHGMVDQLREPSRYANKALTEILYTIANNSKGGVMYEINAVNDPKRFEQQWASTDAAIRVNDGALSGGKIQPKAQSALPSGYENVLAAAKAGMFEVTGVNPEFLGSSENKQVSALLEAQRIEQVVSTLATYFDSITLYQKESARLMLTYMRVIFENNPSVLVRVIGENGVAAMEAVNDNALFAEYDVDVQEVPTTPVQKRENLTLMLGIAQNLLMTGQNIYPALIDDMPIKETTKERVRQQLDPQLTPEQQAQQLRQAELAQQVEALNLESLQQDLIKKQAEVQKIQSEIAKLAVDSDKTRADTTKTIEEAQKLDIENDQLLNANTNQISFTV
jgi:hypothetical protein